MKRNLLYFVYPKRGTQWAWNIEQIRPHLGLFGGRRMVGVAQDDSTEPTSAVAAAFGDPGVLCFEFKNDPSLWETAAFIPMLSHLRSLDGAESTFYAHAKGVRHEGLVLNRVRAWVRAMVLLNLGCPQAVDRLLERRGAVGCLRRVMAHEGSAWHYSGNFFWFRNSALFSKDWTSIHRGVYGVEAYLGRHLAVDESYDLTGGRDYGDLYRETIPGDDIRRVFDEMVAAHRAGTL